MAKFRVVWAGGDNYRDIVDVDECIEAKDGLIIFYDVGQYCIAEAIRFIVSVRDLQSIEKLDHG